MLFECNEKGIYLSIGLILITYAKFRLGIIIMRTTNIK